MRIVVAMVAASLLAGCGAGPDASKSPDPQAPSTSPADAGGHRVAGDLEVAVTEAEVRGGLADQLEIETYPPGLLSDDRPTWALITFANTTDDRISLADLPFFAVAVDADEGDGRLGVAGICGEAWRADGTPIDHDPCAAASPVLGVPAGESYTLPVGLYPRVEAAEVGPGRYDASIRLALGSTLEVTYQVRDHDPDTLTPWPPRSSELTIGLEEVWLDNPYRDELDVEIVVEDPYGRELARRAVADIVDAWDGFDAPSWTLSVPPGVWTPTVVSQAEGGPQRCGGVPLVVADEAEQITTVILNIDRQGRC